MGASLSLRLSSGAPLLLTGRFALLLFLQALKLACPVCFQLLCRHLTVQCTDIGGLGRARWGAFVFRI